MENKKSLVIVESPTKAKTINRYLGKEYEVASSMGHLIDLPKSRLAVDVENGFKPDYITIRGRGKILKELRKLALRSKKIFLAADSDREGEAISFHIGNALQRSSPKADIKRVVFNEITENAIKEAIKKPRNINLDLVKTQKARRVLDRLVGYNLSPLLWEKIKRGLSAGRVQSVALKVICEREDEIRKFVIKEYWTIEADFKVGKKTFAAKLIKYNGKKVEINSETEAFEILEKLRNEKFIVESYDERKRIKRSPAPFNTSKLQQAAGSKLGYTSRRTMKIAQQLYEGVNINKDPVGLITYMRTDSVRIASHAQNEAKKYIIENYDGKYLPDKPNIYKNKSNSQDAHESIRPSSVYRTPESIKSFLKKDQFNLYKLIWEQFLASQMVSAVYKQIRIDIKADGFIFRANGQKLEFDGFLKVLKGGKEENEKMLPPLEAGNLLKPISLRKEVHYTEPPPRFTDSTLVKFLEESGIGRPSTYAPIISTLIDRYYIERENKQFKPTLLGTVTNSLLVKNFPELLSIEFTSNLESKLDEIALGKADWVNVLDSFYHPFIKSVEIARKRLEKIKGITDEETDYICEKCGKKMVKKLGRYGFFLACSGFPECRNTKPIPLGNCPITDCDGNIVKKKSKRGRVFYGCDRYPECDFVTWNKPSSKSCPRCSSIMIEKSIKGNKYLVCLNEQCEYREPVDKTKMDKVLIPM